MNHEHKNARTQNQLKQLKSPGLVASYNLSTGNRVDLFSKKKASMEVDK